MLHHQLILASESPRRRQLLEQAGFIFDVVSVKVSETPNKNLNANDQILDIASRKARAAFAQLKSSPQANLQAGLIPAADTEVIFDQAPLGKPQDAKDAKRILRLLSGTRHEVLTAVCFIDTLNQVEASQVETTFVSFRKLTEAEIADYVATGEPMDKAGAYGIQGLGAALVEKIEGPFDNVVGLPVAMVENLLKLNNWLIARRS